MKLAITALPLFATLFLASVAEAQTLTRDGSALYVSYCASCHGMTGKGDGPVAIALKTTPPDLTRISARNNGKFPLERIAKVIAGDGSPARAHGTRDMPVWGPFFSRVENDQDVGPVRVDNLARYLRQLQTK